MLRREQEFDALRDVTSRSRLNEARAIHAHHLANQAEFWRQRGFDFPWG